MGKKHEKKLKVTHCKGKETTEQAEICTNNNKINNPKSQQTKSCCEPQTDVRSRREKNNRGRNPGPQS
jgi:hypothetical protein